MLFRSYVQIALLEAAAVFAMPSWPALQEYKAHLPKVISNTPSLRPNHPIGPKHPGKPFPPSPARTKYCYVKSHGDGKDDADYILDAIKECNNGGHVIFSQGIEYTIGTALDLTFLNHVDIDIQGYIQFTNDTTYWQTHSFRQIFQNATTFFQLGGHDINVFGGGTIDGNGQIWYDLYASDIYILRPILFGTIGLHGGSISDLNLRYSPQYYNFVANSSDVVFSNISISGFSTSANVAKNTDGWDTYRSSNIVIQNSRVDNGDDCVSFKPNSTDVVVQGLQCNGSHGISVGSLGQYVGEVDIVKNIYVYNITMTNATDGARIKVWPGIPSALSGDLQGGGGTGAVSNITYNTMHISNVDYAIEITQCYGQKNLTLCNQFPSSLTIEDVTMEGFTGTTSAKFEPIVGYLVCSSPSVCREIEIKDIEVVGPEGGDEFTCEDVPVGGLEVNCTSVNKGSN
ncbi:glycoside hydrolase family 28 protein [Lepidopterella palustris CBS 459.81]|uniref:galacturonan 1,4-alpha-galacturonidase n=1 Tax=Lepidopterella palustris CBS 459.81 TaxID=1314670 RepID=A0A8E2EGJ4_9PEZI|nr:glycoside hydrolase family 28 protein [Lepidopterella palustris CBS 459.81]